MKKAVKKPYQHWTRFLKKDMQFAHIAYYCEKLNQQFQSLREELEKTKEINTIRCKMSDLIIKMIYANGKSTELVKKYYSSKEIRKAKKKALQFNKFKNQ